MATWVWILIAIAVALAVAGAAFAAMRARRSRALQSRFGPEYERTLGDAPSRRKAEAELRERQHRRDELDIRPLTPAARERYGEQWRLTQEQFVDAPDASVRQAGALVTIVMRERGYPIHDFDRRADDISVDHPHLVGNYRDAQRISQASAKGSATTEDLRQAMVHFRSLFDELLGDSEDAASAPLTRDESEPVSTETRTPFR